MKLSIFEIVTLGLVWSPICWNIGVFGYNIQQRFATEPSPQTAVIGSTVVLPCRVINRKGEVQWSKNGLGLGNERQLIAFPRYGMIGSDEEGDFSLKISPVNLHDDADFQCQVTGLQGVAGVRSQVAKLTVYVPPRPPDIADGPVYQGTAGTLVSLRCTSKGGKPAAEIQWLDSTGRVILDGVNFDKTLLEDGHRYDAKSTLTFMAERRHHNAVITCSATNPALKQPHKSQVRLEITFAPVIQVTQDKPGYKEGENAVLRCSSEANPSLVTYRWYRGGKLVSDGNDTKLVIQKVTRDTSLEDITCEATNSIASSKKSTRIIVHYGPSFKSEPQDVFADYGESVTLRCDVGGSPEPRIVWIPQKNSSFIFGRGPTINLTTSNETVGTYLCLAKVDGFQEISTTIGLFLKGPPNVQAERLQWGKMQEKVRVECFVPSSTPNSLFVTWTKNNMPIDLLDDRYELSKESKNHGVVARLLIKAPKIEDFGSYNCSVQNAFGTDVAWVMLKQETTLPLTLIASFCVGGVVFVLVSVLLWIFLFRKRTSSKGKGSRDGDLPGKNSTTEINEKSSIEVDSDVKLELQTRCHLTPTAALAKDAIFEPEEQQNVLDSSRTATYVSNNSTTYLYDNYNGFNHNTNGHATSLRSANYEDFVPQSSSSANSPSVNNQHSLPPFYNKIVSNPYPTRHLQPVFTPTPHSGYGSYHKDYDTCPQEALEGLRGLSSTHTNGYAGGHYKQNSTTLPLSLQVKRNESVNSNSSPVTTANMANCVRSNSSSCTIPRLGIPADSSQYIIPPRTQLVQGSLATHV